MNSQWGKKLFWERRLKMRGGGHSRTTPNSIELKCAAIRVRTHWVYRWPMGMRGLGVAFQRGWERRGKIGKLAQRSPGTQLWIPRVSIAQNIGCVGVCVCASMCVWECVGASRALLNDPWRSLRKWRLQGSERVQPWGAEWAAGWRKKCPSIPPSSQSFILLNSIQMKVRKRVAEKKCVGLLTVRDWAESRRGGRVPSAPSKALGAGPYVR